MSTEKYDAKAACEVIAKRMYSTLDTLIEAESFHGNTYACSCTELQAAYDAGQAEERERKPAESLDDIEVPGPNVPSTWAGLAEAWRDRAKHYRERAETAEAKLAETKP